MSNAGKLVLNALRGAADDVINPLESFLRPAGSDPRYRGAAPNRTMSYERYVPKKLPARMSRLQAALEDEASPLMAQISEYVEKGKTLDGPDWYNTEELRDWFIGVHGAEEGDKRWREFGNLVGTTSTGSKVPPNIRNASFYMALSPEDRVRVGTAVAQGGGTPAAVAEQLGIRVPNMPDNYKYGHKMQRNQGSNVVKYETGEWSPDVPDDLTGAARTKRLKDNNKTKGFGNDLLGDDKNIAADKHFMRILAMNDGGGDFLSRQAQLSADNFAVAERAIGPRNIKKYVSTRMVNGKPVREVNLRKAWEDGKLKDPSVFQGKPTAWDDVPSTSGNEYAELERLAGIVAERFGMTPAQFQASLWMGAGDVTGLADESQGTFMQLLRGAINKRAAERGIEPQDMLMDFIKNRAVLSAPFAIPVASGAMRERGPR
ncbi:MAG: hypothetical protein ACPF8W_00110 [Luminiphilus sp.]